MVDVITDASGGRCVGRIISCVYEFVYVRALKGKQVELSTPNLVHIRTLYGRTLACVDPKVKGQGHRVIRCTAAWRESAGRYDCFGLIVNVALQSSDIISTSCMGCRPAQLNVIICIIRRVLL